MDMISTPRLQQQVGSSYGTTTSKSPKKAHHIFPRDKREQDVLLHTNFLPSKRPANGGLSVNLFWALLQSSLFSPSSIFFELSDKFSGKK